MTITYSRSITIEQRTQFSVESLIENMGLNLHLFLVWIFLNFHFSTWQVENVKQRCLPNALNYPMLEEYDFRNDTVSYLLSLSML